MELSTISMNTLDEMIEIQGRHGNWNCNPYMHGMLNGMIYARSLLSGDEGEVQFRAAPETWLDDVRAGEGDLWEADDTEAPV